MQIKAITNKGKDLIGKRNYVLYEFRKKVMCLDNQPGYLFVSVDEGWSGIWVRKDNDKNFQLIPIPKEVVC